MKRPLVGLFTLMMLLGGQSNLLADDFDDGISKATDDTIAADEELGKASRNIKYIIETAKSQSKVAEKNSGKSNNKTGKTTGDNNQNSVVMGAGSKVSGDIYIIDNGK